MRLFTANLYKCQRSQNYPLLIFRCELRVVPAKVRSRISVNLSATFQFSEVDRIKRNPERVISFIPVETFWNRNSFKQFHSKHNLVQQMLTHQWERDPKSVFKTVFARKRRINFRINRSSTLGIRCVGAKKIAQARYVSLALKSKHSCTAIDQIFSSRSVSRTATAPSSG